MRIKKKYQSAVKDGKVLNIKSNSQNDTYSCDYINRYKTEFDELWSNPNTTVAKGAFTITPSKSYTDYKYLLLVFRNATTADEILTNIIFITTEFYQDILSFSGANGQQYIRRMKLNSNGTISFENCSKPGVAADNNWIIPFKIMGIK